MCIRFTFLSFHMKQIHDLWRLLRKPFPLPSSETSHKCEWEVFDINMAGCLLCGAIHVCSSETCKEVEHNEDGTVCVLTGFYINLTNFKEAEYSDCVMPYAQHPAMRSNDNYGNIFQEIPVYVHELLCSEHSKVAYACECKKFYKKLFLSFENCVWSAQDQKKSVNIPMILEEAIKACKATKALTYSYDEKLRRTTASGCVYYISNLIGIWITITKKKFKKSETKSIIYGLVYLMRTGVTVNGICILPRYDKLVSLLPPENMLGMYFDFRSKYITDTENRLKFLFKNMNVSTIKSLGFQNADFNEDD